MVAVMPAIQELAIVNAALDVSSIGRIPEAYTLDVECDRASRTSREGIRRYRNSLFYRFTLGSIAEVTVLQG